MRLRRRREQAPLWIPTFTGIDEQGQGYVHEMCAFCFGGGEANGCTGAPCYGKGYIITPYATADETTAILAEHARRGTTAFHSAGQLDTMGHVV